MPRYDVNQPHMPLFGGDFSPAVRSGKYMFLDRMSSWPSIQQNGTQAAPTGTATAPAAAADGITTLTFGNAFGHRQIELHQTTAQTLFPTLHATKGLEIALDQVDNETVEYVPGGNSAANPLGYLAGTDPGVFFRATLELTTNNGIDQLMLGWRKRENYLTPGGTFNFNGQAPGYTDFAGIGFAAAVTNPNVIRTSTTVGAANSIATSTGFTVVSGSIVTLEVRLKGRQASYFVNGARLGNRVSKDGIGTAITAQTLIGSPAYTVTSGLFMIPWLLIRQDAGTSTVFLRSLACGSLAEDGLDNSARQAAV